MPKPETNNYLMVIGSTSMACEQVACPQTFRGVKEAARPEHQ
jgi:hypothetical protein